MFQREADEADEVGKASGLRAAFDLAGPRGSVGVPEVVLGPSGVVVAQFLFQFLEHRLGEALFVGAAVKNLQRGDLGFVPFDVVTEGSQERDGLFFRGGVEALLFNRINGDGINGLLGFLFGLRQGFA